MTGKKLCGIWIAGLAQFRCFCQKAKKVYGVEIVPQAIEGRRENARLNGIENVEFFVGEGRGSAAQTV